MTDSQTYNHNDLTSHFYSIGYSDIVFIMATRHECGPNLAKLIKPVITGVGPVEAAITTSMYLTELWTDDVTEMTPRLIVSLGTAGSYELDHGKVYQVSQVVYRDMDATALGFPAGVTPFLDQYATIDMATQMVDTPTCRLATGASVVGNYNQYRTLKDKFNTNAVDMETYAVWRAIERHKQLTKISFAPKFLGLRAISDGKKPITSYDDWHKHLGACDEALAETVKTLLKQIGSGTLEI